MAVFIIKERVLPFSDAEHHVTAASAVAAVRTAFCDVLFTAERNTSVAAVAGTDVYINLVDEHGLLPPT